MKDMFRKNGLTLRLSLTLIIAAGMLFGFALPAAADSAAPDKGDAAFESRFFQNMINNHAVAARKAIVCMANATRPELHDFCVNLAADHSQDLNNLRSLYASWYGTSYDPQFSAGDLKQIDQLSQVQGERFDAKFLKDTVREHRQTIIKGFMCTEEVFHEELADHCQANISDAAAEIHQMQAWSCEWFEDCQPERPTFFNPVEETTGEDQ